MANESSPLLCNFSADPGQSCDSPAPDEKKSSWSRRQLLVAVSLCLSNVAFSISFAVISPFYPTEAARKGASPTVVGLVFGIYELIIFATAPIYGSVMHRLGAKYMFISGSFILGGCSICFGFLDKSPDGVVFIVMCFVCRVIEANGASMLSTASFAIMAKSFPDDIGKTMGILETFGGIGMILGPSVGGGLYSVGGFKLPFLVVGGLIWVITIISYFALPEIGDITRNDGNILSLLKIPGCVVIYFVIVSCAVALTFLDPTFSPFMINNFKLTTAQIGLMFMISPGLYALAAPLAGYVTDKGWLGVSLIIGLFGSGLSFLLLGPSPIFNSFIPTSCVGIGSKELFLPKDKH